jgi:hypothetical protein
MRRTRRAIIASLTLALALTSGAGAAWGAVGCELNDPDRDVARLFPGSTGYRTQYRSIAGDGGDTLLRKVERRLGDSFTGIYETADVPYTLYEILKGKDRVGWIHGVNAKGQFGGIQVFLALDPAGTVTAFYIQKLTSQYAKELRDPKFGARFVGLTLRDFAGYDVVSGRGEGKAASIPNPAPAAEADFRSAMRAVKKNLILMDEFVLGNRYDTTGGRP